MAGGRAATEADALPVAEVRDAIPEIAEAILGLPSKRPVRVGICGRSAAGKTTFGDKLAASLTRSGRPVLRAQFDDFTHRVTRCARLRAAIRSRATTTRRTITQAFGISF